MIYKIYDLQYKWGFNTILKEWFENLTTIQKIECYVKFRYLAQSDVMESIINDIKNKEDIK